MRTQSSALHCLSTQLDPSLWDCMLDHLLYQMYHLKLPSGLTTADVLRLLVLADRLLVARCIRECNAYFARVPPPPISWDDVSAYYSLPDALRSSADLTAAAEGFSSKLAGAFRGDFGEAWSDPELRTIFLQLPKAAVEQLAAMDLEVVSENVVATALASWIAHDRGSRLSAGQDLALLLRLAHLSQAYTKDVLMHLPGIGEHITRQMLLDALQYRQATMGTLLALGPACFPSGPRPPSAGPLLEFRWTVSLSNMLELVEACLAEDSHGEFSSPDLYYNGFMVRATMRTTHNTSGAPYLYLLLSVGARAGDAPGDVIPVRHVDVRGDVMMPGVLEGLWHRYSQGSVCRSADPSCPEVDVCLRSIALGEGCVRDAATLVAAVCKNPSDTSSLTIPAPPNVVARLQQVLMAFTVSCD